MWGWTLSVAAFEGGKERSCVLPRADYTRIRRANVPLAPRVCSIQSDFVTAASQQSGAPDSCPVGVKRNASLGEGPTASVDDSADLYTLMTSKYRFKTPDFDTLWNNKLVTTGSCSALVLVNNPQERFSVLIGSLVFNLFPGWIRFRRIFEGSKTLQCSEHQLQPVGRKNM